MMKQTEQRARQALASLARAVHEALNKKSLLGQYAVMEKDGRPARIPPEQLPRINTDN